MAAFAVRLTAPCFGSRRAFNPKWVRSAGRAVTNEKGTSTEEPPFVIGMMGATFFLITVFSSMPLCSTS